MSKVKGPRIISVFEATDFGGGYLEDRPKQFHVTITFKQLRALPDWVQEQLHWGYTYTNNKHCEIIIHAKDELEAAMRFKKLWAAITKLGE